VRTSAGGEVFRYSRDGDVRIYSLRVVANATEVWRVTLVPHDDQPVMQAAELSSRTFCNVVREFSSFRAERGCTGYGAARTRRCRLLNDHARRSSHGPDQRSRRSVIMRPRRRMGISRTRPIGWPQCRLGVRRPTQTT